jgi:hypothetical protein
MNAFQGQPICLLTYLLVKQSSLVIVVVAHFFLLLHFYNLLKIHKESN